MIQHKLYTYHSEALTEECLNLMDCGFKSVECQLGLSSTCMTKLCALHRDGRREEFTNSRLRSYLRKVACHAWPTLEEDLDRPRYIFVDVWPFTRLLRFRLSKKTKRYPPFQAILGVVCDGEAPDDEDGTDYRDIRLMVEEFTPRSSYVPTSLRDLIEGT